MTTNDDTQICLLDLLCLIAFFFSVNLSHTLKILVSLFNYTLKKNKKFTALCIVNGKRQGYV